ncbi:MULTISPECIES: ABC transporter ATP-binding protein [Thermococcus]|uniref:ABC transporter ATP-binding protein n=1 Tax=Thermococcus TaxID=2263 RepID=UPI001794C016|nr:MULTISPECIES: ABC transporter ATP-binding protein [Thermococcus]MBC7095621.1 ABC transporter ATP-binding protein [Thermococcus sp.]HII67849.1 ABC transporter ATP-binding protein [Thermococcaceae archaeon]
MSSLVRLEVRVSFSYDQKEVLKNVSFSAKEGDLLAIVGPNGAGKSTLLKCLVGMLKPKGYAKLNGINLLNLKPKERAKYISYVPQSSYPEFAFTVEEFVELGSYATGGSVEDALKTVGMWERKHELVTKLSGGEYQLVLVARALAQGSNVMLLDEPTSHLDINHALRIMNLLKTLKKEKIVVTVMHDLNLALNYADNLLILDKGEVRWIGRPSKLTPEILEEVYEIKAKITEVDSLKIITAIE